MGIKIPPPLLLLFYAFLVALRPAGVQSLLQIPGSMPSPRPLCASQFTLVNYACATLPISPLPGTSPIDDLPFDPFPDSDYELPESGHDHHNHHHHQHNHHHHHHHSESGHHHHHSESGHHHHSESGHHHGQGHSHVRDHHHSRHRNGHGSHDDGEHRHMRRREHEHRHRGHHHRQEDECCRWLQQVDPQCVCNVLVHLPTFLSRPNHIYTTVVGDSCNVTFACGGRFRP